jgi:hypothetical protein
MPFGLWQSKWDFLAEELRDQRADYTSEVSDARLFNRELVIRLEKTYGTMGPTLGAMTENLELVAEHLRSVSDEITPCGRRSTN